MLLAMREGQISGGIAYRDRHDGSCEMKRLFVPSRFQGQGTGRLLCQALLDTAADDGYRVMRLDTGSQNSEALAMYKSLGFRNALAYHERARRTSSLTHLRFLEKPLVKGPYGIDHAGLPSTLPAAIARRGAVQAMGR